jgi:hypothetical protein
VSLLTPCTENRNPASKKPESMQTIKDSTHAAQQSPSRKIMRYA